ncbi:MAG TPA: YicC family protein [Pseudomonadota bacterium]|nr:YicC family protein [Pseudomonadota bacterium]
MRSMTGFGYASGEVQGHRCVVEMRSFNHRFFDLKLRLPPNWNDPLIEQLLTQTLRKRVHRGSLIVTLRQDGAAAARPQVQVDLELGRSYGQALRGLWQVLRPVAAGDEGAHPGPLPPGAEATLLQLVTAQPGVLTFGERDLDAESRFRAIEPLLDKALDGLAQSRQREGQALHTDLLARLGTLGRLLEEVIRLVEQAPEQHRRRLSERVARLLDGSAPAQPLDPQRLAQEIALIADRLDVSEEITRLRAHMAEFTRLCQGDALAGRQLDFLTQELHREVNTIGSKSQSAEVAARIVAMKAELERLREQIQNVE